MQVETSGINSGNATSEMLSPVQETEALLVEKPRQFQDLNQEIAKINQRRESFETNRDKEVDKAEAKDEVALQPKKIEDTTLESIAPAKKTKERKVSRFRVSVVTEPDPNKLNVKERTESDDRQASKKKSGEEKDICSIINDTYLNLENIVATSYPNQGESIVVCVILLLF